MLRIRCLALLVTSDRCRYRRRSWTRHDADVSEHSVLRLSFDAEVNAAYLGLQPRDLIQPSAALTVPVDSDINLDFDDEGRLIGIEILAATTRLHAAVLRDASVL